MRAPHRELGQDRLAPGAGRAGAAHLVAGRDDPSGAGGRLRRGGRPAAPAGRRVRVGLQHARAGLPPTRVALAPLEPHPLALNGLHWYAQRALPSLPPRIDLLLVDGPPAFEPHIELSRYPALPALAERLAPDATVILDDIDRPGELRILKTWERDYDFRFEVRPAQRIAIGHRS